MNLAATLHPTTGALARRDRSTARLALPLSRVAAAVFAVALLAAAMPAQAWNDRPEVWRTNGWNDLETWANGRLVDVQLRVDGEASPLYFGPGHDDRRYFQAFAGRNYSVVLKNNSGRRVAVLLAVDGLNAVNGEITQLKANEGMYVLGPWEQATIRGWRTSLDEVRRFVFVDEQRSYAERTGQANSDMGWIRVLSFREQQAWWPSTTRGFRGDGLQHFQGGQPQASAPVPMDESPRARAQDSQDSKDAAPAPSTNSMAPEAQDNLKQAAPENGGSFPGTGWGQRQQDRVNRTQFTPDPVAVDRLIFRYEYASGLQALGIEPGQPSRDRLRERDGELGFARPPHR